MAGKESRLQFECVRWYRNDFYKYPMALFAIFNEGANVGGKISMGLVPGVSDLLFYERGLRGLIGIELKFPGESHNVEHVLRQARWILEVCDAGGFCCGLDQFKQIIQGESAWHDPRKVIAYLSTLKTKSFTWDGSKFT